jgi:hypothetical protein
LKDGVLDTWQGRNIAFGQQTEKLHIYLGGSSIFKWHLAKFLFYKALYPGFSPLDAWEALKSH